MSIETLGGTLVLPLGIFLGASVQTAGGLGFGLIAGPLLVAVIGSTAGIQVAILLNIVVALIAWGSGRKHVRYDLLLPMVPGCCLGLMVGLLAAVVADDLMIKLSLCVVLAWITLRANTKKYAETGPRHTLGISLLSGLMGGALAIPGPAVAMYLRGTTVTTEEFRSTMMPALFFVYLGSGLAVYTFYGIDIGSKDRVMMNAAVAALGCLFGHLVVRYLSDTALHKITHGLLIATFLLMTVSTASDLVAVLHVSAR